MLINSDVYPSYRPQIVGLIAKKTLIKVSTKYTNSAYGFILNLIFELFKYTEIHNHAIELVNSQQLLYKPIYSLKLVELEILKVYIEINLTNKFFKHTEIYDHTIELVDSQQLLYRLIYSLKFVELKILKAYIKTNLTNKIFKLSKLPANASMFFNQKLDRFF